MATTNQYTCTTIKLLEDLSSVTAQYHAIAFNDSKLANNAEEASGILMDSVPATNEHINVALAGEIKFAAGGAITAGDKLTVTTSGWFTTAGSDDGVVGECKYTVTSGSIGTGIFNFANDTAGQQKGILFDITAADGIGAGFAYALNDNKLANNGDEFSGAAPSAISSGNAGQIMVMGICTVHADPADNITIGEKLTVSTSGYFKAADSGYWIVGQALEAIGSDSTGEAFIYAGNVKETL